MKKAEEFIGVDNLYLGEHGSLVNHLVQSLKAESLYKKDDDYAVIDGEVMIIDEFTGRILEGRRWSEGLHQAVEAKEGVAIREENQTLATITLQNYFRLYDKLSGMTGTALTEATEFMKIYKMPVVEIPTNQPMVRADHNDQIFKTKDGKWKAVLDEIVSRHEKGQPILVGTVSVEVSEMISEALKRDGIKHAVLNAKPEHAEREGELIAQAGRKGAVMIATNMAGRGVDIKLGGDPEHLAIDELKKQGITHESEGYEEALAAKTAELEPQCKAEAEEVRELGGLFICGTERHESRRVAAPGRAVTTVAAPPPSRPRRRPATLRVDTGASPASGWGRLPRRTVGAASASRRRTDTNSTAHTPPRPRATQLWRARRSLYGAHFLQHYLTCNTGGRTMP